VYVFFWYAFNASVLSVRNGDSCCTLAVFWRLSAVSTCDSLMVVIMTVMLVML
jgi:hypothetical protein